LYGDHIPHSPASPIPLILASGALSINGIGDAGRFNAKTNKIVTHVEKITFCEL